MKNRIRFILLALAAAGGIGIFLSRKSDSSVDVAPKAVLGVKKKKSMRPFFSQPVNLPIGEEPAQKTAQDLYPKECVQYWHTVVSLSMEDWRRKIASDELVSPETCEQYEKDVVGGFSRARFESICREEEGPGKETERSCTQAQTLYRTAIVDWLSGNDLSEEKLLELETSVLLSKLISRFHRGTAEGNNMRDMAKIADVIIAKEPNLYVGYKAKAMALAIDSGGASQEEVEKAVFECEQFEGNDIDLIDMRVTTILKSDPARSKEALRSFLAQAKLQHPRAAEPIYWDAYLAWTAGDKVAAIEKLDQAAALDATNERYPETKAKLAAAAPGTKGLFTSNFGFSISFDD